MIAWLLALLISTAHASTIVDHSGTITVGGSSQTLMASNASRHGCSIQNESQYDMWFNELGSSAAASEPSHLLPAGGEWICPSNGIPTTVINIYGGAAGQAFSAREW